MNNGPRFIFCLLLLAVISAVSASVGRAQANRTWVSGVGDDVNPCSRTAPCKTFAGAIGKTMMGGEICALDPGGLVGPKYTERNALNAAGQYAMRHRYPRTYPARYPLVGR